MRHVNFIIYVKPCKVIRQSLLGIKNKIYWLQKVCFHDYVAEVLNFANKKNKYRTSEKAS